MVDQFIKPESKVCVHGIDYRYAIMLIGMEWSDLLGLLWRTTVDSAHHPVCIPCSMNHYTGIDVFGQVLCLLIFFLLRGDGSWLVPPCLSDFCGVPKLHSFPASFFLTNSEICNKSRSKANSCNFIVLAKCNVSPHDLKKVQIKLKFQIDSKPSDPNFILFYSAGLQLGLRSGILHR